MNFVTNVFKKYINKNEVSKQQQQQQQQKNTQHESPLSDDEDSFEDAQMALNANKEKYNEAQHHTANLQETVLALGNFPNFSQQMPEDVLSLVKDQEPCSSTTEPDSLNTSMIDSLEDKIEKTLKLEDSIEEIGQDSEDSLSDSTIHEISQAESTHECSHIQSEDRQINSKYDLKLIKKAESKEIAKRNEIVKNKLNSDQPSNHHNVEGLDDLGQEVPASEEVNNIKCTEIINNGSCECENINLEDNTSNELCSEKAVVNLKAEINKVDSCETKDNSNISNEVSDNTTIMENQALVLPIVTDLELNIIEIEKSNSEDKSIVENLGSLIPTVSGSKLFPVNMEEPCHESKNISEEKILNLSIKTVISENLKAEITTADREENKKITNQIFPEISDNKPDQKSANLIDSDLNQVKMEDSSKKLFERQDTSEFENLEKRFRNEELLEHNKKTVNSPLHQIQDSKLTEINERQEAESNLRSPKTQIKNNAEELKCELNNEVVDSSENAVYYRQDTQEFERLEKQIEEGSKQEFRLKMEAILDELITDSASGEVEIENEDKLVQIENADSVYKRENTSEFEKLEKEILTCNSSQIKDVLNDLETVSNLAAAEESGKQYCSNIDAKTFGKEEVKVDIKKPTAEEQQENMILIANPELNDNKEETNSSENVPTNKINDLNQQELDDSEIDKYKTFSKGNNIIFTSGRPLGREDIQYNELPNVPATKENKTNQQELEVSDIDKYKTFSRGNNIIFTSGRPLDKESNDLPNVPANEEIETNQQKLDDPEIDKYKTFSKGGNTIFTSNKSLDNEDKHSNNPINVPAHKINESNPLETFSTENNVLVASSPKPLDNQKNKIKVSPNVRNKQIKEKETQLKVEADKNKYTNLTLQNNEQLLLAGLNSIKHGCKLNGQSVLFDSNKENIIDKYKHILKSYEQQITLQASDLEKLKTETELITRHFTNTEMAFSDVFEKYEKSKAVIEAYRRNEDILLENIENAEEQLGQIETKCLSIKRQSTEELKNAQKQVMLEKEKYQQDVTKLRAQVKRLEIKASSLEIALRQKNDECQALAALCDDITGRSSK